MAIKIGRTLLSAQEYEDAPRGPRQVPAAPMPPRPFELTPDLPRAVPAPVIPAPASLPVFGPPASPAPPVLLPVSGGIQPFTLTPSPATAPPAAPAPSQPVAPSMSILSKALEGIGISRGTQRALTGAAGLPTASTPLVPQLPAPVGPGGTTTVLGGGITLPGGITVGFGAGQGRNGVAPTAAAPGARGNTGCPPGWTVNKRPLKPSKRFPSGAPAGVACVRRRSMDPMNVSALKRADRRIEAFSGISRKVLRSLGYAVSRSRGPGASSTLPASSRKKKAGCGCK